jgi:hypothetical protein
MFPRAWLRRVLFISTSFVPDAGLLEDLLILQLVALARICELWKSERPDARSGLAIDRPALARAGAVE